ncbi:ABC transporter ATP-binding protein VirB [Listeria cossartiae]|uniref:ABC transporter ATP-binding protein VirB n=1 Tax=Listeria cossartiae TaxID=2838249 RepID=UPI001624489A|nr:ABC transporter ATP-binding protein VirB [Listeria cossartiae]MBC1545432.1 ABC transporter ATP-binding protein [Listeria cossartiae subsp. cossartiae]MBC1547978.1 ABC transporter ATP-binding protein [Listeria cossartiae subsp. cossartiae]MBC1551021.1 ABC transporter ATP-binding protein [Listeria cossartiae subsp. cossartiae]MBC1569910.1 ABC transporter ATP-binding protein [Listeria cossartiae subsp. cossartiae]MBC1572547.1 ABC transporter ATP-binding protein [Listeria cossartiae subsp. coss
METVLKAHKVRKVYGSKGNLFSALGSISLEIQKGSFVGIMGPSGAGKSTLLNVLSSIDKPTSGEIEIGGKLISQMNGKELAVFRRDQLGFIFQDYNLLDTMTVKDNIVLPLALAHVKQAEIDERFEIIARQFGIYELRNKYPTEISGGQKQRTAVCRAMITEPTLIFADEPTGALDSKAATNLLEGLSQAKDVRDSTIMMVTHDAFAASYCERIMFIKDGEIFTEIYRGTSSRKQFFQKVLDVLALLGGGENDVI